MGRSADLIVRFSDFLRQCATVHSLAPVAMIGVTSARPLAPVIETARLNHGHRNERCQDCDDADDDQSHEHRIRPIQIWAFEVAEAEVHDTTRFSAIERSAELGAKRLLIKFCA